MVQSQQSLNLYMLIHVLHTEATNVNIQLQFITNGLALRYRRPKYQKPQEIILKSWSELTSGDISVKELLKRCARMNGPSVSLNE